MCVGSDLLTEVRFPGTMDSSRECGPFYSPRQFDDQVLRSGPLCLERTYFFPLLPAIRFKSELESWTLEVYIALYRALQCKQQFRTMSHCLVKSFLAVSYLISVVGFRPPSHQLLHSNRVVALTLQRSRQGVLPLLGVYSSTTNTKRLSREQTFSSKIGLDGRPLALSRQS